ncbi:hypothetical protein M3Y95_00369200 [Aphelenchoides besseyi]|nr:hypothetical protein M3Y95_00369200 [Aphelenchoides besseyi]
MRGAVLLLGLSIVVCVVAVVVDLDYNVNEEDLNVRVNYRRLKHNRLDAEFDRSITQSPLVPADSEVEKLKAKFVEDVNRMEEYAKEVQAQVRKVPGNPSAGVMRPGANKFVNEFLCHQYICEFVITDIKEIVYAITQSFTAYRNQYKLTATQLQKVQEDKKKELPNDNGGNATLTCPSVELQTWKCGPESNRYLVFGAWAYANEADTCRLCPVQNCCSRHDDCWDAVQKGVPGKTYEKCDDEFSNCVTSGYSEDLACQKWFIEFPSLVLRFGKYFHSFG